MATGGAARKQGGRGGAFTLVELLVSLSILAVIAAISLTAFRSVSRIAGANRENEEAQRAVRGFLERLDVELAGAMYVSGMKDTSFVSRRLDLWGNEASDLSFATLAPHTYLETGNREEVMRVSYEIAEDEERREMLVLTKKVYPRLLTPEVEREPVQFVIRRDLARFAMRFYQGGKWYESWDTQTMGRMPDGVELIFSIGGKTFREYFNVFISES